MAQGNFDSNDVEAVIARTQAGGRAAVAGFSENPTGTGAGVYGESRNKGGGVVGIAKSEGVGVYGESKALEGVVGVTRSTQRAGVAGYSEEPSGTGAGVYGEAKNKGAGVVGVARGSGAGILGLGKGTGAGVYGESGAHEGVTGVTKSPTYAAIAGYSQGAGGSGAGVYGEATNTGAGVVGHAKGPGVGVLGLAKGAGAGVFGESGEAEGVVGVSKSAKRAGVAGYSQGVNGTGAGVYGEATNQGGGVVGLSKGSGAAVLGLARGSGAAGYFEGDVHVTGDVILKNADCAEDFTIVGADVEPGSVVIIDDELRLRLGDQPYDRRVAGVISGAGNYRPGIILDRTARARPADRMPLALIGKVFCKVDAAHGAIQVGDLLTTSPTPGHAMRVTDSERAPGAVIGKALQAHVAGTGLIAILVSLQ